MILIIYHGPSEGRCVVKLRRPLVYQASDIETFLVAILDLHITLNGIYHKLSYRIGASLPLYASPWKGGVWLSCHSNLSIGYQPNNSKLLEQWCQNKPGTSSTALVPASTALQPLTQNARSSLDESMLGHLVNALDGNQSARPMLEDVRTGASLMDMHIGPPMSMAPLIGNGRRRLWTRCS